MAHSLTRRRVLGLAAVSAIGLSRGVSATVPLRFGLTPVFLDNDADVIQQLRAALSQSMGMPVELVQRRTYQEVTGLLLEGALDAAWLCGYPYLQHQKALNLIGIPVWQGQPFYRSYLIAAADDAATILADLERGTHAFSDPDSNSGWLVTASDLARIGRRPESFFARTIFTYGHRNVVRAVASGDGDAGRALDRSPALLSFMIRMPMAVDEYLLWSVSEGGLPFGSDMPAFRDRLTGEQIWQVIAYMRAGFPQPE